MNILLIGNGFDLAHGLPTKYTDFLEFIKVIKQALSKGRLAGIDWENTNAEVQNLLKTNKGKAQEKLFSNKQTWEALINNNIWIEYFLHCNSFQKENWVDFESEIGKIIQSIDLDMQGNDFNNQIDKLSNKFLNENILYTGYDALFEINGKRGGKQTISFKELRDRLYRDLNRLIRALEIYLADYVEKIDCKLRSPDIQRISKESMKIGGKSVYDLHVLSFNYTNTYRRLYIDKEPEIKSFGDYYVDYIHGKANINNTINSNNVVLGIDEYLPDDRKNKDIEYIAFKKYYQRIYKGTGCKYKKWVDRIHQDYFNYLQKLENVKYMEQRYITNDIQRMINNLAISEIKDGKCPVHNLYIFGHSLDVTDKDILRDLLLNDNVYTTIYYHNKDTMGQQIANLVKVIGQDELIRRTGGSTKTIEFKQQQDMVPIGSQ